MARNLRKPSERLSKKESLKVNVKNSGKVKKQSKDVTIKVTKTKATVKCSKCSKVINGKTSKVKMCASCLKSISNLSKQKSVPPSKPKSLQTSKIKSANKKTNARASISSNKNNPVTGNILLNSKSIDSSSKTYKSPKKGTSSRKSNDGAATKNNKNKTPIKPVKKDALQSNRGSEGKMGLRGKKRSYVQLASGVSDDENKTKKMKTAKAAVPIVRETRDKKPTPKASEWLSTISPKRKSPKRDKKKATTKSVTPRSKLTSTTPTSSKKSISPSKKKADKKKNTTSSASKKSVKRQSNTKVESTKPSPPARNKVNTIPSTAKTATPTRSSTRRSAKFTSDAVQKKTRNSSVKSLNRAVKKDDTVKSNNTDLKDSVLFAKEILEDILISVGNDSVGTMMTNDNDNNKGEIDPHIDFTGSLENNVAECAINDVTCEEGHNASAADEIELHLSPEKDNELHISPKKGIKLHLSPEKDIKLHLSPEKDIELHLSPETADTEMGDYDHQGKDKVHGDITESVELVDSSYKSCSREELKTDSRKVDNKCNESSENTEPQETLTNTCNFDDEHNTSLDINTASAGDNPHDKLKTTENGISHNSHENIGKITNVCPLQSKGDLSGVASSPSSDTVSQTPQGLGNSLPILDSTKHNKSQDEDPKSSVVSASEGKNNTNESSQHKSLDINSDSKIMCKQALNEHSPEMMFKSTEKKITSRTCLPEENKSFGCLEKCSTDNNLSSNGHKELIYLKENSTGDTKDANRFKESQTLSEVSPTVHSTTHSSLKISTGISHDKTKALHIMQDTFSEKSDIHSPATNNKEQIDAQVQLDEPLSCHTEQEDVTAKNEISHIKNLNHCKIIDAEVSSLESCSNNTGTGHLAESSSKAVIDKCEILNNEVLATPNSHFDENKSNEETQLKYDKCKTKVDGKTPSNVLINDGEDSMTSANVDLSTKDNEDHKNKNNEPPAKSSDNCKPESEKLASTSFDDPKIQTDDILLTNVFEKSEDCKNKSDPLLPTTEFENCTDESCQKLPGKEHNGVTYGTDKQLLTSESDGVKNEVNEQTTFDVAPLITDSYNKSCNLAKPGKHGFKNNGSDQIISVTRESIDGLTNKTGEEKCHKEPQLEESKTSQSDPSGLFNRFETKLSNHKTEEVPYQKEQSPPIKERNTTENNQRKLLPSKNEIKTNEDETVKEQFCQKEQSHEKEECRTPQNDQSGIFYNASEIKEDNREAEEETQSCQKGESTQIEDSTSHSNQSEVLITKIIIKPDEVKTGEGPSCKKEQSLQLEECKTTQRYQKDKTEEEKPPFHQKAKSPQLEEYKTTQGDEKGMSPSEVVVKTDEENTSNVPLVSEVVSRIESPMNVDNKTDFDNNENCDELTLKIEESREDCISIDGTDVESMQCNSETRSSNRMSVDEEVITMDIDQDDTTVDGSECKNFGIKVSNELNMEVN